MFDQFAGDDSVELFAQIHGFDVGTLGIEAQLLEDFDAGGVDIDAEGVFVHVHDALEEHVGLVVNALLRAVFGGAGIDAAEIEDVALLYIRGDDFEAVGDSAREYDLRFLTRTGGSCHDLADVVGSRGCGGNTGGLDWCFWWRPRRGGRRV
jgi:hypothetical protein